MTSTGNTGLPKQPVSTAKTEPKAKTKSEKSTATAKNKAAKPSGTAKQTQAPRVPTHTVKEMTAQAIANYVVGGGNVKPRKTESTREIIAKALKGEGKGLSEGTLDGLMLFAQTYKEELAGSNA